VSLLAANAFSGTTDSSYQCNGVSAAGFTFQCLTTSYAPAGQYVLLLTADSAPTPVTYTMQGVCRQSCPTPPQRADVTSVSPASGPAEQVNEVVVHGTGLTLGTTVTLVGASGTVSPYAASPVSVSADGTTLTVLLATYGITPGTYGVVLDSAGYTTGTRSPGYLPNAYTVTPAPGAKKTTIIPRVPIPTTLPKPRTT
jgi:hypothetical protein